MGNIVFDSSWIFTAAAWLLGVLAVVLFAWALFWDRSRGRRRCPGCWYDMTGASAEEGPLVCPECGKQVKSARGLRRTRRRWKVALLALPLVVGAYLSPRAPAIRERGWMAALPTTVLILVAPRDELSDWFHTGGAIGAWMTEIRAREAHLTGRHIRLIASRIAPRDRDHVVRGYDLGRLTDHRSESLIALVELMDRLFSVTGMDSFTAALTNQPVVRWAGMGDRYHLWVIEAEPDQLSDLAVLVGLACEEPSACLVADLHAAGRSATFVPATNRLFEFEGGLSEYPFLVRRDVRLVLHAEGRIVVGPSDLIRRLAEHMRERDVELGD